MNLDNPPLYEDKALISNNYYYASNEFIGINILINAKWAKHKLYCLLA